MSNPERPVLDPRIAASGNGQPSGAAEPLEPPHPTDLGNAERFARDHRETVRYVQPWNTWLVWDGRRWAPDATGAITRLATATVKGIYAEAAYAAAPNDRAVLAAHAVRSEAERRISAMLKLAASAPGIPILPEALDRDPMLLTMLNGTLHLRRGDLGPHRREDLITKLAPVEYDPAAACPQWNAFLERIFAGNASLIAFLQRSVGYGLTGDTSEQCFFIFWGKGANGKTTLVTVVMGALGDYAMHTPAETLLAKRWGDAIPNDVARLRGARFVAAVEADLGRHLAEGLVKQMTGQDRLTARFMRAEWFEFAPTFKLYLATNHKPIIRGTDDAIWRRVRLVPFTVSIPEAEQDRRLAETLRAEHPGILRWAVEGCLAWQRDGLGIPDAVRVATAGYREEMDLIGDFLGDRTLRDPAARITSRALYAAYMAWCDETREKPISKKVLGVALAERGFIPDLVKAEGRVWCGLRLRTTGDPERSGNASEVVTDDNAISPVNLLAAAHDGLLGETRTDALRVTDPTVLPGETPL